MAKEKKEAKKETEKASKELIKDEAYFESLKKEKK